MGMSIRGFIGAGLMVGSGAILFAMGQKPSDNTVDIGATEEKKEQVVVQEPTHKVGVEKDVQKSIPLDKDVAEEAKINEEKQQKRAELVKEQEQKARAFIEAQEKPVVNTEVKKDDTVTPVVKKPEVTLEVSKKQEKKEKVESKPKPVVAVAKGVYVVKAGDYLGKIASQHGISAEVLAEANNMHISQALKQEQKLKIPSAQKIAQIQKKVKQNQAYRKSKLQTKQQPQKSASNTNVAKTKTTKTKDKPKKSNVKFGVQVASGADEAGAKSVVAKLRSAGYQASSRKTGNGEFRIIVGPARGSDAAEKLKNKVSKDSRVTTNGAWVVNW